MNRAEKIAAKFSDGMEFTGDDGSDLEDVCLNVAGGCMALDCGNASRYVFDDGSSITISGDEWDIGYPDCMCFRGAGHSPDCPAHNAPEGAVAWKYTDPTEEARWIFDEDEMDAIRAEDAGLIVEFG